MYYETRSGNAETGRSARKRNQECVQSTQHEMIPAKGRGLVRCGGGEGAAGYRGTTELQLVEARDCATATKTENIKHFE
jgi:hypothetical protein